MKLLLKFIFFCIMLSSVAAAQEKEIFTLKLSIVDSFGNSLSQINIAGINNKKFVFNANGLFETKIQAGNYQLQFSGLGFYSKQLNLTLNKDTLIRITMGSKVNSLNEVVVTSNSNREKVRSSQMGVEVVDRELALSIPAILGEVDIIKVLQLKPGVKNAGEGTSGISVRGGGTDQNLFLMDGAPVYSPSHLFGFFSTFNIDAIKDVQLYKAGFPAEYSGRLSSVIAVNSAAASDSTFSIGGGIGLIASRLNVQGNLLKPDSSNNRRLSYSLSGRRTYADIFTRAINSANQSDTAFNRIPTYYFYDLNGRVDYHLSDKDQFFLSHYSGRDFFNIDTEVFGSVIDWGNIVSSLHWKHTFNKQLITETSLSHANYKYELNSDFDRFSFKVGSAVTDYTLTQKFSYTAFKNHVVNFGFNFLQSRYNISRFNVNSTQQEENLNSGERLSSAEGGVFVSDLWDISNSFQVYAGARLTGFNHKESTYWGFEPRFNMRYLVNDDFSLKMSYSRMQQYKHLVVSSGAILPTDIWYPSTDKIKPEISDQVSLGLTLNLNDKFLFSNEAYYKKLNNVVDFKPGAQLFVNSALEDEFVFGKGEAYGNEIYLEKTAGKLKGWIGYTLAWTTRQFEEINDGKSFFPRYDRRHEVTVVTTYPVSKRLTASANWTYYTGNAVSVPTGRYIGTDVPGVQDQGTTFFIAPVYPSRNNYRLPDYHRLDVGLIYKLKPKQGTADLTFSAYNTYNRLNAYSLSFQDKQSGATTGNPTGYRPEVITLFPIIPSITYNFRF